MVRVFETPGELKKTTTTTTNKYLKLGNRHISTNVYDSREIRDFFPIDHLDVRPSINSYGHAYNLISYHSWKASKNITGNVLMVILLYLLYIYIYII